MLNSYINKFSICIQKMGKTWNVNKNEYKNMKKEEKIKNKIHVEPFQNQSK